MVTGGSCSASIDFPFFPLFFHPVTTFGALASFDAVHRRALNKLTCAVLADSAATLGTRPHSDRIALFGVDGAVSRAVYAFLDDHFAYCRRGRPKV